MLTKRWPGKRRNKDRNDKTHKETMEKRLCKKLSKKVTLISVHIIYTCSCLFLVTKLSGIKNTVWKISLQMWRAVDLTGRGKGREKSGREGSLVSLKFFLSYFIIYSYFTLIKIYLQTRRIFREWSKATISRATKSHIFFYWIKLSLPQK